VDHPLAAPQLTDLRVNALRLPSAEPKVAAGRREDYLQSVHLHVWEAHLETPATFTEKRLFRRQRALKGGRIVFNRAMSTVSCTMRNFSDGGARLEVASVLGIPESFDLKLDGHPSRSCMIVWRQANMIGVEFTAF
jgi:hypothetical protein